MPAIKKGEKRSDYIPRCVAYVMKNEGLDEKAAVGKCEGMYDQHKKHGTQYDEDMFQPPETGNAPAAVKDIISAAYSSCRTEWVKKNPNDKENADNKTSCSKQAWAAVHNAGWKKDVQGNWKHSANHEMHFEIPVTLTTFTDGENKPLGKFIEFTKEVNGKQIQFTKVRAVAAIGDRVMKGIFVPAKGLAATVNGWNGTVHDMNHMATSYPDTSPNTGFARSNIEYVLGYNDDTKFDPITKELSMTVNISHEAPHYQAWKNYVDICEVSGKTPNVSMSVMCNTIEMTVDEANIPANVVQEYGLNKNDVISYMVDIQPRALTTALKGVCSDAQGCGLNIKNENEEATCSCGKEKPASGACEECKNAKIQEDAKKEAYLDKRIKSLKGGN